MTKTPDQLRDEEWLRLMLAGDGEAFASLYQRWQHQVYRFALRMSGSAALAEDITHDVFLTLMKEGAGFAGRGTFAAYLFAIARHSLWRRLQRERRFVSFESDDQDDASEMAMPPVTDTDPLAQLSRHETAEAVRQAVQALPLHYREVVLLCHLHEMSYAEAAEIIGCEIGTVCSRLYRARALLAKSLRDVRPEPAPLAQPSFTKCLI